MSFIPRVYLSKVDTDMLHSDSSISDKHIELFAIVANFFNKNVSIDYENGAYNEESNGTDVTIKLWSAPDGSGMDFPALDTVFGYKYCTDGVFTPKEGLKVVGDNVPLLEYDTEKEIFYFMYDVCELRTVDEYALMEKLIKEMLIQIAGSEEAMNAKIEETFNAIITVKRGLLLDSIMREESRKAEDRKRRLEENKNSLEDYRRQVRALILQIQTAEAMAETGESKIAQIKERLEKEIEIMTNNKKVEKIDIDEKGKIVIYTDTLYSNIRCRNTVRKYRFGKYRIVVNLGNGEVHFFNRSEEDRRKSYWSDQDHHPHVKETGTACLGSASGLIADCIDQYQWGALADILINFLESVNIADPAGKNFWRWDEIDENGNVVKGEKKFKYSGD